MTYLGDFHKGATVRRFFTTVNSSGAPTTLAGTPAISAYEDGGTTEITAGITLTVDFDSRTGMHVVAVDTSNAAYSAGKDYNLVITTGTVGGGSVVGYVVGTFSIENRYGIVDALLKASMSRVEASANEHSLATLVLANLEWSVSGTTLTIKRTDGSTTHFTKTLTATAGVNPVTGIT
jgi:hypothetical protein